MKKFIILILISGGLLGVSNTVSAQKIGYLCADEIIQLMPEAADVQNQLNQY